MKENNRIDNIVAKGDIANYDSISSFAMMLFFPIKADEF